MGHDRAGCDSTDGSQLESVYNLDPSQLLLHIPPTSKRSQAIQVSKLPSPGAVTPYCCPVLLRVLESKAVAGRRLQC